MSVPYLQGGESPTAASMNALIEALDAKLTKLLSGKSFVLGQSAQMPRFPFCGKAFFFTTGTTRYSKRVPDYIETGTGMSTAARPYNHTQFTAAVASIDLATVTTNLPLEVAEVPAFAAPHYAGLPQHPDTGLLGWSLQAHTLITTVAISVAIVNPGTGYTVNTPLTFVGGTGKAAQVKITRVGPGGEILGLEFFNNGSYLSVPADPNDISLQKPNNIPGSGAKVAAVFEPRTFYIQEAGSQGAPEKRYKYTLVELILEGVTSMTIPQAWDKHNCFRIHNLNHTGATVTFAGGISVTLLPLECKTVRRDSPTENYRLGLTYFLRYEPGDPRFYWMQSRGYSSVGNNGTTVTNSMVANNLVNPAMVLDWVNFFTREMHLESPISFPSYWNGWYAGWTQDATEQCDVYAGGDFNDYYGDPNNAATLLGDLIHHKGEILIVRSHKTQKFVIGETVTEIPLMTFETMRFNGYATIVPDFAAHQLQVVEDSNENYRITSTDPDNNVYLVPYGTNLFKKGEERPARIDLSGTNSWTIENAVFEQAAFETAHEHHKRYTATPAQQIWHGYKQSLDYWTCLGFEMLSGGNDNYEVGDLVSPAGGAVETFPTTYRVASVWVGDQLSTDEDARGRVAGFEVVHPGGYETPPPEFSDMVGGVGSGMTARLFFARTINRRAYLRMNPTDPQGSDTYVYVSGPRLWTTIIGNARAASKTVRGIHKVTVENLLTLDWWGDAAIPGQASDLVTITDKKLTLTPEGMVITFKQVDSSNLEPWDVGDGSLRDEWVVGKRNIPKVRKFTLRGHGWGYFHSLYGSKTSPMLVPKKGRIQHADIFKNEVAGPGGSDFELQPFTWSESNVRVQTRINFESNGPLGNDYSIDIGRRERFWKCRNPGDKICSILFNKETLSDIEFSALWHFGGSNGVESGAPPYVGLALTTETYNALARAVNAVKSGTPLQWATLRFTIFGVYVGLDETELGPPLGGSGIPESVFPRSLSDVSMGGWNAATNTPPLQSSVGIPGYYVTVSVAGGTPLNGVSGWAVGDIAYFTSGGIWVKRSTVPARVRRQWDQPVPINAFKTFDQGSQMEVFCNLIGAAMLSEHNLPLAGFSFADALTKPLLPSVFYNRSDATLAGMSGQTGVEEFGDGSVLTYSEIVANINITTSTEKLSTAALLAGLPTGGNCTGTYDRSSPPATHVWVGDPVLGHWEPLWVGGEFMVANDGSGTILSVNGEHSMFPNLAAQRGKAFLTAYGEIDLKAYDGMRWVTFDSVRGALAVFGLGFSCVEFSRPLRLDYFSDPLQQKTLYTRVHTQTDVSGRVYHNSNYIYLPFEYNSVPPHVTIHFTAEDQTFNPGLTTVRDLIGTGFRFSHAVSGAEWKQAINALPPVEIHSRISHSGEHSPSIRVASSECVFDANLSFDGPPIGGNEVRRIGGVTFRHAQVWHIADPTEPSTVSMEYHGSSYESVAQAWPEISNSFPGEEFHYPQFTALAVQNIYANPSDAAAIPMQRIYQHTFFKQQTNVWLNHGIFEKWFGQRGFSPVEHVGAPADGVVTLSPGLNLIAPPTNSHAKILFSVQRPVIKL